MAYGYEIRDVLVYCIFQGSNERMLRELGWNVRSAKARRNLIFHLSKEGFPNYLEY